MSNTFKCWLIANFETVATVVLVVVYTLIALVYQGNIAEGIGMGLGWGLCCLCIPGAIVSVPPSFTKTVIVFLLTLGGAVLFLFAKDPDIIPAWFLAAWIVVDIFAFVTGFFVARYAHANFREVVSRRMLYWNSNVSLFEQQWKYALDRFSIVAFYVLYGIASSVLWIYSLLNNEINIQ